KIQVDFKQQNNTITIQISDNGNGFDLTKVSRGNGLKNMEKRITEVSGKINISSTDKNGTTIIIVLNT
ncbi:MAG: hypothetical protein HWD85_12770, partial [Flavobacteriaceae bacterium]|nr:hypothetical protein [Flavobacteriaceae bacterium]